MNSKDGIVLISGTGICIHMMINGNRKRFAGWGYLIDNGGSGYNFGRDILNAYFSAYEESSQKTILTEMINNETKCTPNELLIKIYSNDKKYIASFAPMAFEAEKQGDTIAQQIVEKNIKIIADLLTKSSKYYTKFPIPVILVGGLPKHVDFPKYLKKYLDVNKFNFQTINGNPVLGAVSMAKKIYKDSLKNE